jgi:prepilin-type N-terminal cleavage/methylation domain-containing protein
MRRGWIRDPAWRAGGFTLLEIMIALAIAGIVVACLFAVYGKTLDVGEQVRKQAELEQSARMIFQQLHKDFEGLYYRPSRNASSPGPYSFLGGGGRAARPESSRSSALLRLGSTTSLDFEEERFPERGLFRVRYLLRSSGTGGEERFTLLREQLAFPEIREDSRRIALTDNVGELTLSFVDSSGGTRPSWDSAARSDRKEGAPLPRVVLVELTLHSGDGTERTYRMRFSVNGSQVNDAG